MIEIKCLTKKFGALTAVNELSFRIERGDAFGFVGPNGAGKTTTIKMLATLLMPGAAPRWSSPTSAATTPEMTSVTSTGTPSPGSSGSS